MSSTLFENIQGWEHALLELHARLAPHFHRAEPRKRSLLYLKGLLSPLERRNGWQLAEHAGEATPDGMQRLLYQATWRADDLRDELRSYVKEHFGPGGILVVDETGFLKKGPKSAGVKRQYSGTAGRIENCQIGVFLAYTTPKGTAFIDRELFLPQEWADDPPRRQEAKVPEEVEFQTKPQLALSMIERTLKAGLKPSWVTGDSVYSSSALCQTLEQYGLPYVLAVTSAHTLRFLNDSSLVQLRVDQLFEKLPPDLWQRLSAGVGSKGERLYDWAWINLHKWGHKEVSEPTTTQGLDRWLLARRSITEPEEITFYRVLAPGGTTLAEVVKIAGTRWSIEVGFEQAKNETGLDEYEVRTYPGWYRHVTLALLAHAWLGVVRAEQQKGALGERI